MRGANKPELGTTPLDELRTRLRSCRHLWQSRRHLDAAIAGLWIAATTVTSVVLVGYAFAVPMSTPLLAGIAAVVLVSSITVGSLWVKLTGPNLIEVARRIEVNERLNELLSTALEQEEHEVGTDSSSPVVRALIGSASTISETVDPSRFIARRPTRDILTIAAPVVLLSVAIALQAFSFTVEMAPAPTQEQAAEATRIRDQVTTDLRRSAELLSRRADERDDPYLQAAAQALTELERLVAQEVATPMEARIEVEQLIDQLARAYGLDGRVASGSGSNRNVAESKLGPREAEGLSEGETSEDNAAESAEGLALGTREDSTNALSAFAELVEELDESGVSRREAYSPAPVDPNAPSPLSGLSRADVTGYHSEEDWQRYQQQMQFVERLSPRPGQAIGAAQQSSRGDSDRGGEGSQELSGSDPEPLRDVETRVELELPDSARSSGRRITLELPPEARLTEVSEFTGSAGGSWQQGNEVVADRPAIPGRHLNLLSRYFGRTGEAQ